MNYLADGISITQYVKYHKPVTIKEMGITEAEYENIYHVEACARVLTEFQFSKEQIEQAIYSVMESVRVNDPKVKNGAVLIARADRRCIVHGCDNVGVYAGIELETDANPLACRALVDLEHYEFNDFTKCLKIIYLCHSHETLNKKGFHFDEILNLVAKNIASHIFIKLY